MMPFNANSPNPSPDGPFESASENLDFWKNQSLQQPAIRITLPAEYFLDLAERHYQTYLSQYNVCDLDVAIAHYRKALELNPNLSEAYNKLAFALWDKGEIQIETAIDLCQQAVHLNPHNSDAHMSLGHFVKATGNIPKAMAYYRQAVKLAKPVHAFKPRMALGLTLCQQSFQQQVKAQWLSRLLCFLRGTYHMGIGLTCLPFDPQSVALLNHALQNDLQVYGFLSLGKFFEQVLGRHSKLGTLSALKVYQWATQRIPQEPMFFERAGDLLMQQSPAPLSEDTEKENALKTPPAPPELIAETTIEPARPEKTASEENASSDQFSSALAHDNVLQPDAAIYFYSRALDLSPDDLNLRRKLAQAYLACHDIQNAAYQYGYVLEAAEHQHPHAITSEDFEPLYRMGQAYTEQEQYIKALYYLKISARLCPNNPYPYSHLAYCMFKLDDIEGAIQAYHSAVSFGIDPAWTATVAQTLGGIYDQLQHDPISAADMFYVACELEPDNTQAWAALADLAYRQGNLPLALEGYQHLVALEPNNPNHLNFLGYLLWQLDRNDEAIEAYKRAIEHNPQNWIAYNNMGVIYLDDQQNPEQAMRLFKRALQLKSDYTLAAFNIARSLEAQGAATQAAEQYSYTLKLNTDNPELPDSEILDRLDNLFRV